MEIRTTNEVALILLEIFIQCFASNGVASVEDQGISLSSEDMQILPHVWAPIINLRENNMTQILPHMRLYA